MHIPDWAGSVSHETFDRLTRYAALLLKWNAAINLIGKSTEQELWQRHLWDAYQVVALIPASITTLADLGSGAGLPGLVIALSRPEIAVTLVERDQRKATFLKEAARTLGLTNVTVLARDITTLDQRFELVTARALASLADLLALAHPILGMDAFCLFPKGENYATEIAQARLMWHMRCDVIPSKTNDKAGIVSISELQPLTMVGQA
jgi:16S rRNA (guanine527-N7)-methyltransferase